MPYDPWPWMPHGEYWRHDRRPEPAPAQLQPAQPALSDEEHLAALLADPKIANRLRWLKWMRETGPLNEGEDEGPCEPLPPDWPRSEEPR